MAILVVLAGLVIAGFTFLSWRYSDKFFETSSEKIFAVCISGVIGIVLIAMSKMNLLHYIGIMLLANTLILGVLYVFSKEGAGQSALKPIYLVFFSVVVCVSFAYFSQDITTIRQKEYVKVETNEYDIWLNSGADAVTIVTEKYSSEPYYEFFYYTVNGPVVKQVLISDVELFVYENSDYLVEVVTKYYEDGNGSSEKMVKDVDVKYQLYLSPSTEAAIEKEER